jgi:hypothetical protein
MTKRVLYFSGYRLSAFHWKGKKLVGQFSFEPGKGGYKIIDRYLEQTANIPTFFVVDIIEEEFKVNSVPMIRGKDRINLINRTCARVFRGAKYTAMIPQGKDPENRFKEKILFASLTNPGLMMPWINKLERWGVPLAGIWSVPLMSQHLLKRLKLRNRYVLLITQQVLSSLRISFFDNGGLVFSRQAKVKHELREVQDAVSYTILLANEVEQTEFYLTNNRIVNFQDKVSVCCLVRDEFEKTMNSYLENTSTFEFHVFSIEKLEKQLGYTDGEAVLADELFSRLCCARASSKDHYSHPKERRFFTEFRIKNYLVGGSVVSVLCALFTVMLMVFDGTAFKKEADDLNAQVTRLDQIYRKEYSENKNLSRAAAIKSTVQLADRLYQDAAIDLNSFFVTFSTIFSRPMFSGIEIHAVEWKKELESIAQVPYQRAMNGHHAFGGPPGGAPLVGHHAVGVEQKVHLALIKGRVSINKRPYRATVAMINALIQALEDHPLVQRVEAIELPIDVRSSSSYSDQSGFDRLDNQEHLMSRGLFSLRILMKGEGRV